MSEPLTRKALSDELFCIRGVSILLVVLVHVIGVEPKHGVRKLFFPEHEPLRLTSGVIHSFNMAVMLINSGAAMSLFGEPDTSLWKFAHGKLRKLVIPMLVWAPVALIVQELFRARPHTLGDWLALLGQAPGAWFPPYSIFWFVHALVGCTSLAWTYKRLMPPLGSWDGPLYLGLSVVLHLAVEAWGSPTDGAGMRYLRLILFCNYFFGLGMTLSPWLALAHRGLSRLPLALLGLVPAGLLGLLGLLYVAAPIEGPGTPRQLSGPLGYCMQFALAVFLLGGAQRLGAGWKRLTRWLVYLGSISMPLYLFHLYFASGLRLLLEKVLPGAPLALHLVLGSLAGLLGPLGLYLLLERNRAFRWSLGLSSRPARVEGRGGGALE
jgi:fucose 4-O-acetylase-like acetyltransferase